MTLSLNIVMSSDQIVVLKLRQEDEILDPLKMKIFTI